MIEGCGSALNERTIFISFHLRVNEDMKICQKCVLDGPRGKRTYSERTRAAVVLVLERCTSLTATSTSLCLLGEELDLGRQSQTLPQFPKPIYMAFI